MFSRGFSQIEQVKKYIAGQEAHHQKTPYREEFLTLRRRRQIPYGEHFLELNYSTPPELAEFLRLTQRSRWRAVAGLYNITPPG